MTNYVARIELITGASLSGSSGSASRTYGLAHANAVTTQFEILVAGAPLMYSTDFTLSGSTITFVNSVWNDQNIVLNYLTTTSVTSQNLKYTTTRQLGAVLNMITDVPDWAPATSPTPELVGTGDSVATIFYLDYKNVYASSYTLYKGTVATSLTALTETTHYSLNKDTGKITLTAAGVTFLSTNNLYAEYAYNSNNISDTQFEAILLRAEAEVDDLVNTTFTNGDDDNPDYPAIIGEQKVSQGLFNRNYFTISKPVIDISTTLLTTVTSSSSTIVLAADAGALFPTAGSIIIGTEIIKYTGISTDTLTGLTRGAYDSTADAHTAGDDIHSTSVQISSTDEGGVPTWYTLSWDDQVDVSDNGNIYIFQDTIYSNYSINNSLLIKQGVPNRLRINYMYGWQTIPTPITRLTLLLAQRMMWSDTILSSLTKGRNEFNPELISVVEREIQSIVQVYQNLDMGNT